MPEQRGVTLIELLVTITVLSIVLGIGLPALRDFVLNNRQIAAVNEMVASMQFARTEAVTRNGFVSLCPSSDQASCTAGDWDVGWIVFSDLDGDGAVDGGDDTVVRAAEPLNRLDFASDIAALTYRRNGRSTATGTFTICDSRGAAHGRVIVMDLAGRPRVQKLGGACP